MTDDRRNTESENLPESLATPPAPLATEGGPPQALVFENRKDMVLYMWLRIRETRRYWLIPVLAFVGLVGLLLNLFTGHNVLPAIYSLIP